jgi:hypothetical protein
MTDTPETDPRAGGGNEGTKPMTDTPETDPRAVALELTRKLDDGLRRMLDFHTSGDLASARVVGVQVAGLVEQLKELIG